MKARATAARRGYNARWQQARANYLRDHPRCERCGEPATVVHHRQPHRGDQKLFWSHSNWEPVCKPCHDGPCQHQDRHGYSNALGNDGLPVDPAHPFNQEQA
jgi:5-methylcytosine-specific restriction protein A